MNFVKTSIVISALAAALVLCSCATMPPEAMLPPLPAGVTEYTSADWDYIMTAGDYVLINCPWNQAKASLPYAHRAFKGEAGGVSFFGWQWYWNNADTHTVLAYPNAACGASPWGAMGSIGKTPGYPRTIGNIDIHSTFDIDIDTKPVKGHDVWDLAYDIWVLDEDCNPADFGPGDIKGEVMVWLDARNFSVYGWLGKPLDTVTENGRLFDYWYYPDQADGNGPDGKHRYMAFVSRTPLHSSSDFDLSPYFAYLVDKGYLAANDYLALVELGTENVMGEGQVIVKNYSVTVK